MFTTSSSAKLAFSSSSILFDTVFTTIGSTTKYFMIYNKNNEAITISSIKFGAGTNSQFCMNIDGESVQAATNVVIPAKDSLFVFVKVTVNPTNQNSPLVIRDSIMFVTNGNLQSVLLEAWGQDAYYHYPNHTLVLSNGSTISYSLINSQNSASAPSSSATWLPGKPHVIYGYAVVDSGCTLTINPNVTVYMHNNAVLWVYSGGSLNVQGAPGMPVNFQGDRLDADYKYIAGQWGEIWLSAGSLNNSFNWGVIKNATIGIEADTIAGGNYNKSTPTLNMSHSIVQNASLIGIYGIDSKIYADNCLFANCGQNCGAFVYGGIYKFNQCTFADYTIGFNSQRTTPTVQLNNYYLSSGGAGIQRALDSAYFGNCIIYGSLTNEVGLDSSLGALFNYKFKNCNLLTNTTYNFNASFHYDSVIVNIDPLFKNVATYDYTIGTGSAAIGNGSSKIGGLYPFDLNNQPRPTGSRYDIGAYQFQ